MGAWLLTGACAGPESRPDREAQPGPTPTVERIPLGELPQIDVDAVLAHAKVLSSDQFEGRAPGGKGEALSVGYLVDQFRKIGLKPGNPDGTFVQKVPLVGITASPAPLVLKKGPQQVALTWKDDLQHWEGQLAYGSPLGGGGGCSSSSSLQTKFFFFLFARVLSYLGAGRD